MRIDPISSSGTQYYSTTPIREKTTQNSEQIDSQNQVNQSSQAAVDKVDQKEADASKAAEKKAAETKAAEAKKEQEKVYGKTLAVSENGDTVSAKKQAIDALHDGLVMRKNEENIYEEREEFSNLRADKAKEDKEEEVNSLTAYTRDQLDTLYQKGKISEYKYSQEISRRDSLEQRKEDVNGVEDHTKALDQESTISKAIAEKAKEDQEAPNLAIPKRVDVLAAKESEMTQRAETMQDAINNGRADIASQVMGQL